RGTPFSRPLQRVTPRWLPSPARACKVCGFGLSKPRKNRADQPRRRKYNPAAAAFVSPDSLLDPSIPQDLNPYAYAHGNPATLSDPTGTFADPPFGPCGYGPCP